MNHTIPEKQGIRSKYITEYIKTLEKHDLATHSLIIMRKGNIVFEKYWPPFDKDFLHRMYSVTKSFVAIAIGFLEQDGLVDLDAPISKYFPEESKLQSDENMRNQTVRHMLMMSTAKTPQGWFGARTNDRVKFYFENDSEISRIPGMFFEYDSAGSFVLGALVERVSGKEFMEYLREKFLDKIGFSKEAYCLKCPGGHAWSDSALLCKPTDLLKVAMFCLNKGKWNGEQLLNENFITAATSKQIDNNVMGKTNHSTHGYGYQFWMTYDNSFFFNGMGAQLAVCVPHKDIIMVYTGDNQVHNDGDKHVIIDNFFNMIVNRASDCELPESADYELLKEYADTLKLRTITGDKNNEWVQKVNGVTYIMNDNPMGITKIKLCFDNDSGKICYTNDQGDKEIPFGLCYNEFSKFPQEGYSDEIGSQKGNRLYDCATSAAWVGKNQFFIKVQIIDTYFGNLNINISFDENKIGIFMTKAAEDFLHEFKNFCSSFTNAKLVVHTPRLLSRAV